MSEDIVEVIATTLEHASGWALRPEQRLCLAILEEAVETLRKYGRRSDTRGRRLVGEVIDWMRHPDDRSRDYSFRVVVDNTLGLRVGIDAEALAAAVAKAYPRWDPARRITLMKLKQVDRVVLPRRMQRVA